MQGGVREIVSLQSTDRQKGHATLLMWTVCHEADLAQMVLMLKPEPFSDGMGAKKLKKFYEKFGFCEIQQEPCVLMARSAALNRIQLAS